MTLILYTGAARVDAVKLGPKHVRTGKIEYRRQKTQRSGGVLVSVPIHPVLAEVLDRLPKDRPFRPPPERHDAFRRWAGEPHAAMDRGRKAAPVLRPQSMQGLCSSSGRGRSNRARDRRGLRTKTLALMQRYTEAACREGMADSAVEKMIARPNGERNLANLSNRFVKSDTNPKQGKDNL